MKISACLSTNPAKFDAVPFKDNFDENVAAIKKMGFDGVELAVRDPSVIDQEKVIKTICDAGLTIPAIGTGQAWGEERLSFTDPDEKIREKAVERVFSHIPFAKRAGGVIIIGLLRGIVREGIAERDAFGWMKESFILCCQEALKEGVRIAFEPINRYETTLLNDLRGGLEFIESVGLENLGILADTFHMNIEEPVIEESLRLAGDRIFHFHYADSNRWYPGAGHLDFESIIQTLKEIGYDGYLSGEHRPDPEPLEAVRLGYEKIKELIERDTR